MRRVDPVAHILNPGHPLARLSTGRVMDSHLLSHLPQVPAVGAAAGEVTSAHPCCPQAAAQGRCPVGKACQTLAGPGSLVPCPLPGLVLHPGGGGAGQSSLSWGPPLRPEVLGELLENTQEETNCPCSLPHCPWSSCLGTSLQLPSSLLLSPGSQLP